MRRGVASGVAEKSSPAKSKAEDSGGLRVGGAGGGHFFSPLLTFFVVWVVVELAENGTARRV